MAYIGNIPSHGEFKKADSIVSSFNGTLTQFDLDVNTVNQTVGDATQLIVSLNGVIQEPGTAYTLGIGGGSVVFASAPVSTDTCHIVILGGVGGTSTVADGAVTASKLDPTLKDYLEETFTADGTQTAFTLTRAVVGANTLLVTIDGIVQPSSAFTASGTTLTISEVLAATTNVRVVHMGVKAGVYVPANDSVTADMLANSINTDIAAKLPLAGGAMTGPITTNSTFDGVDVGARDGVLTATTTTANAALPKAGGTMTGVIAGFESTGIDDNATSTAMTIDSSGNVVVGETSTGAVLNSTGGTGAYISADGQLAVSNVSNRSIFNRKTTDGDILEFRKDGATVGSIGVQNTYLTIGKADTGIKFQNGVDGIHPWDMNTNAARDSAIDLGTGSARFKDLYLSGGVNFGSAGGSGAPTSNVLDDYEEGTWVPVPGSSTFTRYQASWYTKIGNTVTCSCYVYSFGDTSSSTPFTITGLPFAHKTGSEAFFAVPAQGGVGNLPAGSTGVNARIGQNGGDGISFSYEYPNTTGGTTMLHSHLGAFHLQFTFTYITT